MDGYAFSSQNINPDRPFTLSLAGLHGRDSLLKDTCNEDNVSGFYRRSITRTSRFSSYAGTGAIEWTTVLFQRTHLTTKYQRSRRRCKQGDLLCAYSKKLNAIDLGLLASPVFMSLR